MITKEVLDAIVLHLLRCQEVMHQVALKISPQKHFDPETEYIQALIVAVAIDYYKDSNELIPADIMEVELSRRIDRDEKFINTDMKQRAVAASRVYYDTSLWPDDNLRPSWALKLIGELNTERELKPKLAKLQNADSAQFPEILTSLSNSAKMMSPSQMVVTRPFDLSKDWLSEKVELQPTGVPFVDKSLNGGLDTISGDLLGVMAPPGGGKTTLNIQLMCELASLGVPTRAFVYEEGLSRRMCSRFFAYVMNKPKSYFDGVEGLKSLPKDVYDQLVSKAEIINANLSVVNSVQSTNGVAEIEQSIMTADVKPRVITIDWLEPMVANYIAGNNIRNGKDFYRLYIKEAMSDLTKLASKYKIAIVMFHQLSGEAASKSSAYAPDMMDSQECKAFSNLCLSCITIGRLDIQSKLARFKVSKCRYGPVSEGYLHLDGEVGRWILRDSSKVSVAGGNLIDATNVTPKTPVPKKPDGGGGLLGL